GILAAWREIGACGRQARMAWSDRLSKRSRETRGEFEKARAVPLPATYQGAIATLRARLAAERPSLATRQASQLALETIVPALPALVGGSADLTHSNLTLTKSQNPIQSEAFAGNYIHYGIREHGMAAAMNGIALHGGFIPYGGTFLSFADYSRPAI